MGAQRLKRRPRRSADLVQIGEVVVEHERLRAFAATLRVEPLAPIEKEVAAVETS